MRTSARSRPRRLTEMLDCRRATTLVLAVFAASVTLAGRARSAGGRQQHLHPHRPAPEPGERRRRHGRGVGEARVRRDDGARCRFGCCSRRSLAGVHAAERGGGQVGVNYVVPSTRGSSAPSTCPVRDGDAGTTLLESTTGSVATGRHWTVSDDLGRLRGRIGALPLTADPVARAGTEEPREVAPATAAHHTSRSSSGLRTPVRDGKENPHDVQARTHVRSRAGDGAAGPRATARGNRQRCATKIGAGISPFFLPFLDASGSFPPSGWVTVPAGRFRLQLDYLRDVRGQPLHYTGYYDTDEQGRDFRYDRARVDHHVDQVFGAAVLWPFPKGSTTTYLLLGGAYQHTADRWCVAEGESGARRTAGLPGGVRLLPRAGRREPRLLAPALRGGVRQLARISVLHPGAVPGAVAPVARRPADRRWGPVLGSSQR